MPLGNDSLKLLPHGAEFRFIDRVVELEPGKSGKAEYVVKRESEFLRGHFPGQPMMPGVLLIEGLAQLGGIIAQSDPVIVPLKNVRLTAVRGVKISGTADPGGTILFEGELVVRMGGLLHIRGEASVNGKKIFRGEITLSGEAQP